MNIKLSKRMKCIADMVTPGRVVTDIGCDHGYISIYLINEMAAPKVIAMDVAEGPLKIAKENIEERELSDRIELRLSDGFDSLEKDETESAVIAGMGGNLIMDIIARGLHKITPGYEMVLSPQSDVALVRTFLRNNGFSIIDEDMMIEDGKYYNIIKCIYKDEDHGYTAAGANDADTTDERMIRLYDTFGQILIEKKHPVLREFLEKQIETMQGLYCRLSKESGDRIVDRMAEIDNKLRDMEYVIEHFYL